jgi:two-component system sensor histidine kinase BaeS
VIQRRGVLARTFLSLVLVAVLTGVMVAVITRLDVGRSFRSYMASLPPAAPVSVSEGAAAHEKLREKIMQGVAVAVIGAVDRGTVTAVFVAFIVAAVAAWALARGLSDPMHRLEEAAQRLAAGDLSHRVEVTGPREVERLADAFNEMADSIAEAEDLRQRLVADVAHELRNPLAAARAQAEGMAEGVLPANGERLASLVEDLGQLSLLVADLQELSVAEAGALHYEFEKVDLTGLVRGDVARARLHADSEGVELLWSGCSGPVWVMGDARRLEQVLCNMVANAMRHTTDGSVEVVCSTSAGSAEVRVIDTGDGIPAEDLPHIFERFYRADEARARDTGGAGVGLAIARRIVTDHGGEVFASSTFGQGAVVGFRLPLFAGSAGMPPGLGIGGAPQARAL